MNLHEYQSKAQFAKFGIPVPAGSVANEPETVFRLAQEAAGPVVIKAQVLVGGRGKAGGIKLASTPGEAQERALEILGMSIKGHTVETVLVDPAANIAQEIYLGIANDRNAAKPVLMASAEGGVEIEEINRLRPEAIVREHIDPVAGLFDYQAVKLASGIDLPRDHWRAFGKIVAALAQCFVESDAELAEINPLVITEEGTLQALDGKMVIDDNALPRQPELAALRDESAEAEAETLAREAGISYVRLEGQIGCMVNGAGLAMTTMDMTRLYGDADGTGPANFLDIGGGARADTVATALRIILSDANVKVVLCNIFGGITRGDEVARGILTAFDEVQPEVPMIIRLQGTNAEEGRAIINEAGITGIHAAATLTEAAHMAVEAVGKAVQA